MINQNSTNAAAAWKSAITSVVIASMLLACPGPGLYSAFAQGSERGTRLGAATGRDAAGVQLIRSDIQDVTRTEQEPGDETDENSVNLAVIENGIQPSVTLDAPVRAALSDHPAANQQTTETGLPSDGTTAGALRQNAAMRQAAPGADGGRLTYDGGLPTTGASGDVELGGLSASRSELMPANANPSARAERVPAFHAHEHEERPTSWKIWALRGGLIAAASAALLMGKVSIGILPLAALSAGVIGSIVAHELAHMVTLKALGDETAKKHGHDSLNPLRHIDFWNTVVTPITTLTASLGFFHMPFIAGAAKPIPADFNQMHDDRNDPFWVALSGPAANLAISGLSYAASIALPAFGLIAAGGAGVWVLHQLAWVNLGFAAFNLFVPLPGFDGAKVWSRFLPKKLYDLYTHNPRIPADYQDIHRRLYVGPAYPLHLLSQLGFKTQPQVNRVVWGLNIAVAGTVFFGSFLWLGAPVVYLMLACAYDYYCIREKIQNEDAVNDLIDILQDFTSELAKAAEQDDSIQSVINQEEVEHVMKNVLEDIIDKVVDSEGFDQLSDDQKWERFTGVYTDEAVKALKEKGMTEDTPETIRRVLTQTAYGQRFFNRLREEFINRYDVWKKWHSPKRKTKGAPEYSQKDKPKHKNAGGGTSLLSIAVVGALGASLLGLDMTHVAGLIGAGMVLGTVQDIGAVEPPKIPTFEEALKDPNLKFENKEKAFLLMHLKEMKLEEKPPITGRIAEMMKLYKNVTAPRGDINSVVLIGEAGVGKTAIPEKLAQAIALSEVQLDGDTFKLNKMKGRYLLSLNLGKMLKDVDPSPVQKLDVLIELLSRFNEASKKSGNKIILFIDEIHSIFEHPQGPLMAQLLKDVLRNGELTVIAATTRKEYKKYMESDDAFRRRLIPIWVDESTPAETMRALQGAKSYYEDLYDVKIHPDALKASAEMSKYDQEVFLPGRAFKYLLLAAKEGSFDNQRDRLSMAIQDKIEELRYVMKQLQEDLSTTELATENLKKDKPSTIELYNWSIELTKEITALYRKRAAVPNTGTPVVTADIVKEQISAETGVAAGQLVLGQEDMSKYIDMAQNLKNIVVGQDEAIDIISQAVKENKAGLSNPDQPLGVFYLTGPTGSGKTYAVKKIAEYLNMAMIRLDMSEYQHDHEVAKMQGAPPGYVGFEAGGQLTEKVRRNPYSVVLFDEIEKAHPAVFMMLLQIMGEGRLTDGQGRLVDFKNTIIMMSSNLGMSALNETLASYVAEYKQLKAELAAAGADTTKRMQIERKIIELSERMARDSKEPAKRITEKAFSEAYPPEFQGRFTAPPIVFNRVDYAMSLKIVDLELKKLRSTLEYAGNELTWDPTAVKALAFEGFDIMLGARPLNNTIRRMVVQPIADAMLQAAKKNGNRIAPSRIRLLGTDDGKIQIVVEPLPPRVVKKSDTGEGAEQDIFSKVLGTVVQAVANQTNPEFGLHEIDGWVKEAITAHPGETEAQASIAAAPSEQPQNAEPVTITVAPAPVPPAPKVAGFAPDTQIELGESAERFVAETYKLKKDAGVQHAQKKLAEALGAKGYPQQVQDAILRGAGDKENPLVGALKLFVEQAKIMGKDDQSKPIQLAFEVQDNGVKLVVHRNGAVSEKEAAMWKTHFTGAVLDSTQARDKAEMLNVMGKDGRRVYFELYGALSAIPGARIGWAAGTKATAGNGVDYWIELPNPPKPEPIFEPAPQGPSASEAEPGGPTAQAPPGPQTASVAPIDTPSFLTQHPKIKTLEGPTTELLEHPNEFLVKFHSGVLTYAEKERVNRERIAPLLSQLGLTAQPTLYSTDDDEISAYVQASSAQEAFAKAVQLAGESSVIEIRVAPSTMSEYLSLAGTAAVGSHGTSDPRSVGRLSMATPTLSAEQWRTRLDHLGIFERDGRSHIEPTGEGEFRILVGMGSQHLDHFERAAASFGVTLVDRAGRWIDGHYVYTFQATGLEPAVLAAIEFAGMTAFLLGNVRVSETILNDIRRLAGPSAAASPQAITASADGEPADAWRDRILGVRPEPDHVFDEHKITVHFRQSLPMEQAEALLARAGASFSEVFTNGAGASYGRIRFEEPSAAARIARTLVEDDRVFRVDVAEPIRELAIALPEPHFVEPVPTPELPQELLIKRTHIGYGENEAADAIIQNGWGGPNRVSVLLSQVGLPSGDPLWTLGRGRGINGDKFTVGAADAEQALRLAARLSLDPRVLRVGLDEETWEDLEERLAATQPQSARPAPPDPRLSKLEAATDSEAAETSSKSFSLIIHPHQQSLADAVRYFAEPLIRQFGLEQRGKPKFLGHQHGIKVDVEARTTEEAVAAAVWLAGHSHIKKLRMQPAMLDSARAELARQGLSRDERNWAEPLLSSEVPPLLDHQWAKIQPAAENGDENPAPSRYVWFTARPNTDESSAETARRIAEPLGLESKSQYGTSDGEVRVRAEAASPTDAARATLQLAQLDAVLAVTVHPATWQLVPPRALEGMPPRSTLNKIGAHPQGEGPQDHRTIQLSVPAPFVRGIVETLLPELGLRWLGTQAAPIGQAGDSTITSIARTVEDAVSKAIQLAAHPQINGVRLNESTHHQVRQRIEGAAGPAGPDALAPNDVRASKIHEFPPQTSGQANTVFWADMTALPSQSDLSPAVHETLERLGVGVRPDAVESFRESDPPMLRLRADASTAELAAFAALELARFPEVTAAYLSEDALALARQRPLTLGPSDPRLFKIRSTNGPVNSKEPSRVLWFEYILHPEDGLPDGGALHGEILPMLERLGLQKKFHQWHGSDYRVQAEAPTLRAAIDASLELASDSRVREIDLHPSTWQLLQSRVIRTWDQDLSAQERNVRLRRIGLLPDSLQVGPSDLLLADLAQALPGANGTAQLVRDFIAPTFASLGLRFTEGELITNEPRIYRARGRADTAEAAALAALALVTKEGIYQALIHPAADALLRERLYGAANGGPKSEASSIGPLGPSGAGASAGAAPKRAAAQARDMLRKVLYAIIAQGTEKRSPASLNAAADALAAVSNSTDDLEKARKDWIRFGSNHLSHRYAEFEAAAMIIGRHGGTDEDLELLTDAANAIQGTYGHAMNPPKRRVAHALARLLGKKLKPGQFGQQLSENGSINETLQKAYYVAAARHGDASARGTLEELWKADRTDLLAAYFERTDPGYLRGLYEFWRDEPNAIQSSERERLLTFYAISRFGVAGDVERLLTQLSGYTEYSDAYGRLQGVTDAFASFVRRTGTIGIIRKRMHEWLYSLNSMNTTRSFIAMTVLGEAGEAEDLPIIEKWVNASPDDVQNTAFHEMTHHEATISWAKMVVRLGLMEKYLTEVQPAQPGQRSATKIVKMLTDQNPMPNKAALAAIQLYFGGDEDFGI